MPPSLVNIPPCAVLIFAITRPVGFQPLSRHSHSLLLHIFVCLHHQGGILADSVSLVATSFFPIVVFSAPNKLPFLVAHSSLDVLELDLAALTMNSIDSDVQPLLSSPAVFSPNVVINDLASSHDFQRRKWPFGRESHRGTPFSWVLLLVP